MKRRSNLYFVLFFTLLTFCLTTVVILTWEKVLMTPVFSLVAEHYPGEQESLTRWRVQQRLEHFFISITVDVIVVTMLLRLVGRQQRELAASEERYHALFEHASDGIGVMTAGDHKFVEVNKKFCDINFAQLLKDAGIAQTDMQRSMLDGIIDEGQRIAKIVRNLLAFARHEPQELSRVNVAEAINTSLALFTHQLQKDGINVELDIAADLPPVRADGSRLRQVVVNMISNAHHALQARTSAEPKLFCITAPAAVRAGRPTVRLEFFDNGTGVPRAHRDKIFDPFFTTKRNGGGTGLGLSLSFGIIKDFGGTISVDSEEGVFTRFTVELPALALREKQYADGVAG
jgi:signal transduction histidine kinase